MINVIGLGYIGLPTALMLAAHGNEVVGTDYNAAIVEKLNAGRLSFAEDGLPELFDAARKGGIRFTTEYQKTDLYIIAVPTPYSRRSKRIDPSYVIAAVKTVLEVCPKGATVVVESTVSPGTMDRFVRPVVEEAGFTIGKDLHLVHAPERIIPGNMVYELEHNSRTIGADDAAVGEAVKAVYSSFCQGEIVLTDIRTAEMTKVVENTYRDINIAYANELAKICRSDNMDVYEIIRIANKHPRVNILSPGPGVGGLCDHHLLHGEHPAQAVPRGPVHVGCAHHGRPVVKAEEAALPDPDQVLDLKHFNRSFPLPPAHRPTPHDPHRCSPGNPSRSRRRSASRPAESPHSRCLCKTLRV